MNTLQKDVLTQFKPQIGIVLGSGLGALADEIDVQHRIPYSDIPDFPVSTAPSHKGQFVFGTIGDKKVVIMQGRVHLYEGYTPQQVVAPIRLMNKMGVKALFLTNASGGINKTFNIGDFMMITDHISTFVPSPLRGKNDDTLGVRFPDMSEVYSKRLQKIISSTAADNGIQLRRGVYIQLPGPAFETPAEIKMCSAIGADAVGMSTAIEAQAARHCSMEVCGISCITNLACGMLDKPISSEEVTETANRVADDFKTLIKEAVKRM